MSKNKIRTIDFALSQNLWRSIRLWSWKVMFFMKRNRKQIRGMLFIPDLAVEEVSHVLGTIFYSNRRKNGVSLPDESIRKLNQIDMSYVIWKPTLVWTVMFLNLLYPSLRIIIFWPSYGLKNFWLTPSLSLISIRKNDWYDFRKLLHTWR